MNQKRMIGKMKRRHRYKYTRNPNPFFSLDKRKRWNFWKICVIILLVYVSSSYLFSPSHFQEIKDIFSQSNETKIDLYKLFENEGIKLRDELVIEQKILELVNQERANYSINKLKINTKIGGLAKKHSVKMIDENFFEHSNEHIQGNIAKIPIDYLVEGCGVTYTNNQIAECMVNGWIESPGHHQHMIDASYSITGIGVSCNFFVCKGTQIFL